MDQCVGVVVLRGDKILLVKNREEEKEIRSGDGKLIKKFTKPSRWGLPTGRQEPDETYVQAAVRETEEETGYIVDIEPSLEAREEYQDHIKITLLGNIIGGSPRRSSKEIEKCEWFPINILWNNNFDMHPSHRRAAKEILHRLRKE